MSRITDAWNKYNEQLVMLEVVHQKIDANDRVDLEANAKFAMLAVLDEIGEDYAAYHAHGLDVGPCPVNHVAILRAEIESLDE